MIPKNLEREEIQKKAKSLVETHQINEKLRSYGRPLFLAVWGAHHYGFPSNDSDVDIRGVYLAPKDRFLGIREEPDEPCFEYKKMDLDISLHELGHYLKLVSRSNGNMIEFVNSNLTIQTSPEFDKLKKVTNDYAVSKKLLIHYLKYARRIWEGKTKAAGVKRDLHTLRAYMTGVNLLEEGAIESDIRVLNKRFGYSIIPYMLTVKSRAEATASEGYDRANLERIVRELDLRLTGSADKSPLPDEPDIKKINDFLINIRIQEKT